MQKEAFLNIIFCDEVYVCMYMYTCMHVCMRVCMYYVCMYVCMYMCMYVLGPYFENDFKFIRSEGVRALLRIYW